MDKFVIMGVAGCGKSTVGKMLASRFDGLYIEGDDLHPASNIEKMSAGTPLSDEDRLPWLEQVGQSLETVKGPAIVGCSALKRLYRDCLRQQLSVSVGFIHLAADRTVIATRMAQREKHFMPLSLLDSQFASLEQLQSDESGVVVDIDQSIEAVVDAALDYVKTSLAGD